MWRGDEVDLDKLPIITCWPEDGGPYITFPMVITKDPKRGIRNVGMYRVQQPGRTRSRCTGSGTRSARRTGARWRSAASGCRCASRSAPIRRRCTRRARRCRRRWTSSSSPDSCARKPVQLAKALTCDLEVPADADFVIEGYIDPAEPLVTEGPFGDHTGFYSLADLYPLVHVTAMTMREARSFRRRSSGVRRWRISTSATPPSESSCRCSSSRSRRSSTTTCRPRGSFTTSCSSRSGRSIRGRRTR